MSELSDGKGLQELEEGSGVDAVPDSEDIWGVNAEDVDAAIAEMKRTLASKNEEDIWGEGASSEPAVNIEEDIWGVGSEATASPQEAPDQALQKGLKQAANDLVFLEKYVVGQTDVSFFDIVSMAAAIDGAIRQAGKHDVATEQLASPFEQVRKAACLKYVAKEVADAVSQVDMVLTNEVMIKSNPSIFVDTSRKIALDGLKDATRLVENAAAIGGLTEAEAAAFQQNIKQAETKAAEGGLHEEAA